MPGVIAWWGWLLIWLGLALGFATMLAWFAWRLFRASLVLADDLADLADQLDILSAVAPASRPSLPALAILADPLDIRGRESDRVAGRRRDRRSRHERRMSRAREIGSVDVTATAWPAGWYAPRGSRRPHS